MAKYYLAIDGGTTNTRFTVLKGEAIIARKEFRAGAADTNHSSGNVQLKQVVRKELCYLQEQYGCMTDIFASGMITSNAGIYEVPHIQGPASLRDLVEGIKTVLIPDISTEIEFHFVPGIRFTDQIEYGPDMMRGEETEIIGMLDNKLIDQSVLFLHCGSHNKLISYYNGKIQESVTTIGGELLWAVLNDTILKSSVTALSDPVTLDKEYVEQGYNEAVKNGLSRALFLARIHHIIEGADKNQVLSFVYGAVVSSDLQVLSKLLEKRCDKIILYGRDSFIGALRICLSLAINREITPEEISVISREDSELLSVRGMSKIKDRYFELKKSNGKEE